MSHVMACIDASPAAPAVCDYAAWASQRLQAPLSLLHVLDRVHYPQRQDLSGVIGLGSREHLLEELAELDERRSKLALEQGHLILDAAKARAAAAGVSDIQLRQRHGDLVDSLAELQQDIRLLVIGRQGEASASQAHQVGSHLESVIRTLTRPILVSCGDFQPPRSYLFAFDGSATARKGIEMLAASPLLKGLPGHLLMVGADTPDARQQLDAAAQVLEASGGQVQRAIRAGEVEPSLHAYQAEQGIELLVMGAYGHSRVRQFLIGSTTSQLLRSSSGPLLILR